MTTPGNPGRILLALAIVSVLELASSTSVECCTLAPSDPPTPPRPLRERWVRGLEHLREDGSYLITFPRRTTRRGAGVAAAFGVGLVGLVMLDDEIRAEAQERRTPSLDWWERRIEPLGKLRHTTLAAALTYASGRILSREGVAETGRSLLEALVFTEVFDLGAKGLFGREPPSPGTRASEFFHGSSFFPSGHTARAFAFATVLAERYGHPAALAGYPLAGLVGLSRIERDAHWTSDVVAGAALGHLVGRAVTRRRASRSTPAVRLLILAPEGDHAAGLLVGIPLD